MATKLEQVLRELEELAPEELEKVQEALDRLVDAMQSTDDETVLRIARERGIDIDLPIEKLTDEEFDRFTPISVEGEPVSETILRERR